jgi:hypothetical protein
MTMVRNMFVPHEMAEEEQPEPITSKAGWDGRKTPQSHYFEDENEETTCPR